MQNKYVPPSVHEKAFNCPHCGTFTTQYWYALTADSITINKGLPPIVSDGGVDDLGYGEIKNENAKKQLSTLANELSKGRPFLRGVRGTSSKSLALYNSYISKCFNCSEISFWIYDKLFYPTRGEAPEANPDLPPEIRDDYNEASAILDISPRGAAALIRLAIQKLCRELGKSGKNINEDIGALVKDGLDPRIQKALDAVRVIGNNAVHPGQIDLRDKRETAENLFRLLNVIAEKMISEPRHVDEVYASLPKEARDQISRRDKKE